MKVYLVRHGMKESTSGDPGLADTGRIQAELTGKYFQQHKIDKVFTSPLLRARETAQLLCQEIGLEYEVIDSLRERFNWGDKDGQTFAEFLAEWNQTNRDRDFVPTNGDSSRKAGARFEEVIKDESQVQQMENIILVTHGGVISDFLRNVFTREELQKSNSKFFQYLDLLVKECSVTIVDYSNGKYRLESLATIDHLSNEV